MFKYISEILSKLSVGQRLLALVFLLLTITLISVGPKIVNAFTQDNEELKSKVEMQRTEIQELTKRVTDLNDQVLDDQVVCTDRFAKREQEILVMISSLESEVQKVNQTNMVRNERHLAMSRKTNPEEGETVMAMERPEPVIVQTDNSKLLSMIKDMKKNLQRK
jgi:cell division septum initiation protein DivIVA